MSKVKQLEKYLLEKGWSLVTRKGRGKHKKYRCPCGKHTVIMALTPSDHRVCRNKVSQIRNTGCDTVKDIKGDLRW